jgi:primosomal protein N' (replication factor Y)
MRVRVPFGRGSKPILGYVIQVTNSPPVNDEVSLDKIKEIESVADGFPVFTKDTLALALWMKEKYYCTLAAAMRCVSPNAKADGRFPMARRKRTVMEPCTSPGVDLTREQKFAVEKINGAAKTFLLHGVTGSGKTEVYLRAIQNTIAQNRKAILLVPEIALTPQMVSLFTARFGSRVAVTHSRLTAGERFQIWKLALDGEIDLVIGPRSAVFSPFANLGLIVIDEEHEHTYHSETTPKYDAREVAVKRAELTNATVVLGSATPSLESYFRTGEEYAKTKTDGKYELLELPERVNKTNPDVTILDMRKEIAGGNMSLFALEFQQALKETIMAGRQAILFLNRRGYSTFVSCRWCGFVLSCAQCRVNHTYHADKNKMLCHYCGTGTKLPEVCPSCGSKHIKQYGTGTQKIEEEIRALFPDVGVLRMDMDTTRGKFGHAKVLDAFREGKAQILIGTQMVAKGLDFPQVTMVGVVAADLSLHTGDFRAGEYTFQLLTQVSGRAGRAMHSGRVFLQTYNPEHYAITFAREADYKNFYTHEMAIRRYMVYPPFSHVFSIMFCGAAEREIILSLHKLTAIMEYCNTRDGRNRFSVIGISPAFVSKIKNQFRWKLLVKCEEEEPLKAFVLYCMKKLRQNDPLTGITVHLKLNPILME